MLLAGLQYIYIYAVEGKTIYVGKRRSLSKRVSCACLLLDPAQRLTPRTPQIETELIRISSFTVPKSVHPPLYNLSIAYRRSSNNNKSLIRKARDTVELSYGELVDEHGGVEEGRIADWIGELVARVVGEEVATPVANLEK